jgi:hypothetical protein
VNYLNELGERKEAALLAAGLGLEHYLGTTKLNSHDPSRY